MYEITQAYVNAKITYLNTVVGTNLTESDKFIELETKPANELNYFYTTKIEGFVREEVEYGIMYTADVVIELSFLAPKSIEVYENIVDDYVWALSKLFRVGDTNGAKISYTSGSTTIADLSNLKVEDLNVFTETGHFQPKIKFQLQIIQ